MKAYYNEHKIPKLLYKYPVIIKMIHAWNHLILLRNWYITNTLKEKLNAEPSHILDAGFGDGQHLFWIKKNFPQHHCAGIDRSIDNVKFCNHILNSNSFLLSNITDFSSEKKFEIITLLSVLQYVEDDKKALKILLNSLSENGCLIIYSPVNYKSSLPFYTKLFNRLSNYEKTQNNLRKYEYEQLVQMIESLNGKITGTKHTIGFFGKLTQEYYSIFMAILADLKWTFLQLLTYIIFLLPMIPLLLLFNLIDFITTRERGNGVLLTVQKA